MNTWLKNKTEASGYPHWADTPEKKTQYVRDYATKEGIHLEPEKIEKNPGRKATAKLMLNSFWGKFGENLRKSTTRQVTSPADMYEIITDPLKEVTGLRIFSEDVMEIVFSVADDECVENGKTNVFVAAFTTCHARLKLYSYLHAMQERVLYFDTDSVIYSKQPGQTELPIGDFLGDLTNEVEHGDHIVDFTSGGPKNYGYRTASGKVECKVRGFSLGTVRGHAQLNYERLRANVLDELTDPQDQPTHHSCHRSTFFHERCGHQENENCTAHQGLRTRIRQEGGRHEHIQIVPLRLRVRKQDKTMTLLHSCKNNMFICALFVNIKTLLQFQTSLGFHDVFDDEFGGGVSSREVVYRLDHLLVGGPFILQSLGTTVIDVVYLGNLVQSIDALDPLAPIVSSNASRVPCTDNRANEIPYPSCPTIFAHRDSLQLGF